MASSLKFVLGLLAIGALATPVSLSVQKRQTDKRARVNAEQLTGGDTMRGKASFTARGCGACHEVTGLPGAHGQVGPALDGLAARATVAGRLSNRPSNLVVWLQHPHAVIPGVGMPELGLGPGEARDIAAFLYTLRKG
jgi:cytochrome c2